MKSDAIQKSSPNEVAYLVPPARPGPPTMAEQKRSGRGLILAAVVAVLVALYAAAQWWLGPTLSTYIVAEGEVLQTIVASGRVETPLRIEVGSQITGSVASIPVAEGQVVKAHQPLILLEDSEMRASVAAAKAGVVQAQARITQIREVALPVAQQALRKAQANLINVRKQYDRIKQLSADTLASQSQLDDAQMNLELAESEARSAQLQLEANRSTGSDYQVAQTALDQARANLATGVAKLNYTRIEAPAEGTLIARNVERGDVVQPGKTLMTLSPTGETQIVVQIDEKNLANLVVGQHALGSADAYPDRQFAAEVVYINPAVDADRGSVEVKLKVPQPPSYLRQDMTVSVDIEVARRSQALAVAADAVHEIGGPSAWVFKVSDAKLKRQPVKIGARGVGKVEVLEGLAAGDQVVSSTGAGLHEGKRVRSQVVNDAVKPRT